MRRSIKPSSNLKSDVASDCAQRQTIALLNILALGSSEIAQGKLTAAANVFDELDRLDKEDCAWRPPMRSERQR
ncbi:hypothetical protein [Cupriavidus basilensis]|uniref:hypothetical protein n=1 Tax=Cupriavidus basilensis TaxID=68895 RepID=UPI0023E7DFB0|nr:hypothetical protein [Cupriavidus basilensis]MDF3888735.1 hypothetical protein [Cupriavidus basilensis]